MFLVESGEPRQAAEVLDADADGALTLGYPLSPLRGLRDPQNREQEGWG